MGGRLGLLKLPVRQEAAKKALAAATAASTNFVGKDEP